MSDLEFDILDELYFVQSFEYIRQQTLLDEPKLKNTLSDLLDKGWIKCFYPGNEEIITPEELNYTENYKTYHYLATKEGLLAHNSK